MKDTIQAQTLTWVSTVAKSPRPGTGPLLTRFRFLLAVLAVAGLAVARTADAAPTAPVESRLAHPPAPPRLKVYDKSYDLSTLENPVRVRVLEDLKTDSAKAAETYEAAIKAGGKVYFQNCVHCHGDHLDGNGMFAAAQSPRPTNLRDADAMAESDEAYLFWRITTGGPGLPKAAGPWNSTMPAGREQLTEAEVWNVILFLYDRAGNALKMRDPAAAKALKSLQAKVQAKREKLTGVELYEHRCSVCHGPKGAGDGPAAERLYPAPRDFTIGLFKYKTSPASIDQPRDEDLMRTIKDGLPGTSMPSWGSELDDEQIRSLIAVVKSFDTVGIWAPKDAADKDFDKKSGRYKKTDFIRITEQVPITARIPFSPESVAEGKRRFDKSCTPCHGDEGRGNPSEDKKLRDDWGNRIWPRDLTKPWSWRWSNQPESRDDTILRIFTRFSVGIPGTRMPEQSEGINEENRWNIANYVYTLRTTTPALNGSGVIQGVEVMGELPTDVADQAWSAAPATTLRMMPNVIAGERLFKPLNDAVSAQVLFNKDEVAFLLTVGDRTYSRPGDADAQHMQDDKLELHADAFAVQFPKQDAFSVTPAVEKPLLGHGDSTHATTIWYWNAGSVKPHVAPYAKVLDADGPGKKMRPRTGDSGLTASGRWDNGRWRVMMKQRRSGGNSGDVSFARGRFIPLSFAHWDGSNGEIGSKHELTSWYWLLLP